MSKIKGLLKGTLGALKITGAVSPFILLFGGLSFIGTVIGYRVNDGKLTDEFTASDYFIERSVEDMNALENRLANGEISNEEYSEEFRRLGSKEYMKELINYDVEGNEKYQAMLKSNNALVISTIALGSCAIVGILTAQIFLNTSIFENIMDSGKDDIRDAIDEMKKGGKKKKPKKISGGRDPRVKLDKTENKPENSTKPIDDMIDNTGVELGDLDDFLEQFTDINK